MVAEKRYKQTEVGLIPEDWKVLLLEDLVIKIGSGITPTGGTLIYKDEGRPFVRSQNIGWGKLLLDDIAFIDNETHNTFPNSEIYLNDVFLNISGASIGRSSYSNEKLVGGNVNQHVCIIRVINKKLSPFFLNYFLLSKKGQKQIDSFQSGGNRQGLNIGQIKTFKVPVPNIAEQTAIASALSNMDELINQTEKLIEKKKAIKQGVMQELLSPKQGWVKKYLPEVCWFQEGPGVRKHQFRLNGVKLLNGTNIQDGKLDLENTDKFISNDEAFGWYSHFLVDEFDVLIACSGVSIEKFHEKVAIAESYHLPLCMNTSTMRFKVNKEKLDQSYFIQFLKSKRFKEQISGKATGSAQLNFGPSHVNMVEIDLPELNVQKEIGKILNDMEFEVSVMELKLQKLKNQKQGMMQALLTGKIRLV
jgi:type I restriction enzyme, S subunit